jgi:hypothetical protein
MNWCTRISTWPSLHSASLHLCNLHIPTTINLPSSHFTSLHLTSLYFDDQRSRSSSAQCLYSVATFRSIYGLNLKVSLRTSAVNDTCCCVDVLWLKVQTRSLMELLHYANTRTTFRGCQLIASYVVFRNPFDHLVLFVWLLSAILLTRHPMSC